MIDYLASVPLGYALGSLPFGLIAGRAIKGVDIRDFGSGKTGMTNVLRTTGVPAAMIVLLLDMGKAALAIALARVLSDSHGVEAAAGIAVLVGHSWPIFTRFKGGRGIASGLGALLMLSPLSGVIALAVFLPVLVITRYMSLASVIGAMSGSIALTVLSSTGNAPAEYIFYAAIGGIMIVARHHDNIVRLLRGEERKLGQTADVTQPDPKAHDRKGVKWPKSA